MNTRQIKTASAAVQKPVAVIILNWNGAALLRRYLPEVMAHTSAALADIIVADNGSTDDSLRLLREEFPGVEVLALDRNYGFAEGYNRAIAATRRRYTVLLNSDVAPAPGWIEPLYRHMADNPAVGACQPKILSDTARDTFEYAGASGGYIDRNGYPYCRGRVFATVEKDEGQYADEASIFWGSGAALMVDTALYEEVGGLDPQFFAHMEEIDLCWRILLAGRRIDVVPRSVVYHLGGGSLPAENPKKTYLNFRNNLLLLHKNLPTKVARRTLLRRRLLDAVAWAKFVLTLDFGNANAILRAHRDFRKMRRDYPGPFPERDLLAAFPQGRRDILLDYYLRGRKRYSDING